MYTYDTFKKKKMTITILTIEKSGSIKEHALKNYDESELYKKAGFKSKEGFQIQTTWNTECNGKQYSISVYGKTNGRAGQENKYEFPPPIDSVLFFGACVLVNKINEEATSLSKEEWKKVYEHLYGGFEDLDDEDEEESEEDIESDLPKTKQGYVKDGFIVDSDDSVDEDFIEELIEKKIKPISIKKRATRKPKKETKTVFELVEQQPPQPTNDNFLECTNELQEEQYIE